MTLSFAVTAYNEMTPMRRQGQRLLECLRGPLCHQDVDEIVVVDDCSEKPGKLPTMLRSYPKVHLYRNGRNLGVFGNKIEAVARCAGDWVITCDSDNRMDADFINRILMVANDPQQWCCPSFARENFDYRELIGDYSLGEIGKVIDHPMFQCFANTGNQTVHRETFMAVFEKYRGKRADLMMPNWLELEPGEREKHYWRLVFDALDSFILNFEWLKAGNSLSVVQGLEYQHHYSGGQDSNYVRSPEEKVALGVKLLEELRSAVSDNA